MFNLLRFRTKFLAVGAFLAVPLLGLAGFAISHFNSVATAAAQTESALRLAADVRHLATIIALHRGLSACRLSAPPAACPSYPAQRQALAEQAGRVLESRTPPEWQTLGLPDALGMGVELRALLTLPDASQPERNFDRHSLQIQALLVVLRRSAHTAAARGSQPGIAGPRDLLLLDLPRLTEALGQQRGWGSTELRRPGTPSDPDNVLERYMRFAGGARSLLTLVEADATTLQEVDTLLSPHGGPSDTVAALQSALQFSQRSTAQVVERQGTLAQAQLHFAAGTAAIEALEGIGDRLTDALLSSAMAARTDAEQARAAAVVSLLGLLLTLWLVYRAFELSTVQRLRQLEIATTRLTLGRFEDPVHVAGSDEIAVLGRSMDAMRERLRDAVAEQAVRMAEREAERAWALLLARWSHDLRTPLSAMLGFARLMQLQPPAQTPDSLTPEQRLNLQRIVTAGEHLLSLVNQLMGLAAAEAQEHAPQTQAVLLAECAAAAIDLNSHAAQDIGVTVQLHPWPAQTLWVQADQTRLLQVLVNLVNNAIKFNAALGRVDVHLQAVDGMALVDIIDTGAGMCAADLARLFQPFERLDAQARQVAGTGLGLVNVKRLVEAMGGAVEVSSQPGLGSSFRVRLPLARAPLPALANPVPTPFLASLYGRVAYVEDNEVNAELMQAMLLSQPQFELQVFGSVAAALASDDSFDIWILDRQLPDGDALQLLQALRGKLGTDLLAVLFSADDERVLGPIARAAGFSDCWSKPMHPADLVASLSRLLVDRTRSAQAL